MVLTRQAQSGQENPGWPEGVLAFPSLRGALQELAQPDHLDSVERVYVIGGAQVCVAPVLATCQEQLFRLACACLRLLGPGAGGRV